nr:hypothetical protein [Tanacetum cinerariifolium]
ATLLAGEIDVPTGSGSIPTAGPPATYLQEYQEFASELPLEKRKELISDLVKYQEHYTKSSALPTVTVEPASPDKEGVIGDRSGDDAPIKERSNNEGEAAAERISNDSEEIARVLTSMDAATVLAKETIVPTGSGFIPTAELPLEKKIELINDLVKYQDHYTKVHKFQSQQK